MMNIYLKLQLNLAKEVNQPSSLARKYVTLTEHQSIQSTDYMQHACAGGDQHYSCKFLMREMLEKYGIRYSETNELKPYTLLLIGRGF